MIRMKTKMDIHYFGREVIRTNWKAINKRPLARAGNKVRTVARRSIKRRKRYPDSLKFREKYSQPGSPPFSKQKGKTPPFKMIFNLPAGPSTEVVGMVGFGGSRKPVPGLHEQGGSIGRRVLPSPPKKRKKGHRYYARKRVRKQVRYSKRPFMVPAVQTAKNMLPKYWKNALNKAKIASRFRMRRI